MPKLIVINRREARSIVTKTSKQNFRNAHRHFRLREIARRRATFTILITRGMFRVRRRSNKYLKVVKFGSDGRAAMPIVNFKIIRWEILFRRPDSQSIAVVYVYLRIFAENSFSIRRSHRTFAELAGLRRNRIPSTYLCVFSLKTSNQVFLISFNWNNENAGYLSKPEARLTRIASSFHTFSMLKDVFRSSTRGALCGRNYFLVKSAKTNQVVVEFRLIIDKTLDSAIFNVSCFCFRFVSKLVSHTLVVARMESEFYCSRSLSGFTR